jgi:hypothetical protein
MSDADEPVPSGSFIRPFLAAAPVDSGHRVAAAEAAPGAAGTSIRPFLVTSGRTAAAQAYPVETQVVSTEHGESAAETLTFEYRDIVTLCAEPVAVAEIAARLSLHLGVIRVLIGDLQHQGLVTTYQPEVDPTDDVEMILRVINGLRQRT